MSEISYGFGLGGEVTVWSTQASLALGDGVDAVALDFDGDGLIDDAMWDTDGDLVADTAVIDVGDDASYYEDPSGLGVWDESVSPGGDRATDAVSRIGNYGTADFTFIDYDADGAADDAQADLDGDGDPDVVLIGSDGTHPYSALVMLDEGRVLVDTDGDGALDTTENLS